jgi:hypothetical protein
MIRTRTIKIEHKPLSKLVTRLKDDKATKDVQTMAEAGPNVIINDKAAGSLKNVPQTNKPYTKQVKEIGTKETHPTQRKYVEDYIKNVPEGPTKDSLMSKLDDPLALNEMMKLIKGGSK